MNPAMTAIAALAIATVLASCGGSSDQPDAGAQTAPEQRLPLAAEEKRLEERRLVSARDLRKARPGSVQRAFYGYWSAIENEEWTIALGYYPREIQRRLKPETLVAALRLEADKPPVKPLIRSVRTARADQTSVRYFVRRSDGKLRPTSMIWRRRGERWYIAYSSTLDDSYSEAVQQVVQSRGDPAGASPSKDALGAAARAARAQASGLRP